ncbi:MAG: T9SS type A sorting domain-containing protein [Bacteroidia bacterium]|nr:T9SS type A sorting domain-containing protein [Bacteroidia bacterium]
MKKILLFIILSISQFLQAQNFTYGSVYNYDVGDTIVTAYQEYTMYGTNDPPPEFTYRVFTAKNYSSDSSSISYQFIKHHVLRQPTYPYDASVFISNESFNVANLDSHITHVYVFPGDTCMKTSDINSVDNCGFNVREIHEGPANNNLACSFEANRYYDEYIEGVGAFWDYYVGSAHKGNKTYLVAAHKVNGKSCGGMVGPLPNGIREWEKKNISIKIYPNPSNDKLNLELQTEVAGKGYSIEIKDLPGNLIYRSGEKLISSESEINIQNIQSGIYFLEIWQEGQLRAVRKITKQ